MKNVNDTEANRETQASVRTYTAAARRSARRTTADSRPLGNWKESTPRRQLEIALRVGGENETKPEAAMKTAKYKGFLIEISARQESDGWSVAVEIRDDAPGRTRRTGAGITKRGFKTESEADSAAIVWAHQEIDKRTG